MLASGLAVFFAFVVAMTTLAFWAVRLEGVESMFNVFFRTARYPVDIYPRWLRGFFTYLFPVAFVSTVPTETLVGRDSGWLIARRTGNRSHSGVRGRALLAAGTQALFERFELSRQDAACGL